MMSAVLLGYLALQFAICLWIARKIGTQDDYLVGGRNLPTYLITFSLFATWFGAETCIGSSAMVYQFGLSGSRADPFGNSLCLLLSGLLIAPKLWNKKYFTLADLYRDRYNAKTEQLATWILTITSLIWGAAQLRAFSQIVASFTDLPVAQALFFSFAFVVAYTLLGGLLGDIVTDLIQGIVILLGLLTICVMVFVQQDHVWTLITEQPLQRLSFLGIGESWWERSERLAIPIMGSLVAQEIVSRIFAAKSREVAVRSCYWSAAIYLFAGSMPVLLGLVGPQLISLSGDHEQFLLSLAKVYLPWYLLPIFSGALISALLATIDSILLSCGSLITQNVLVPVCKITEDKSKLRLSRLVVLLAGIVAYLLAVYSTSIYDLVETASSFGTAGILVITLFGLWSKLGDGRIAFITLLVGIVTTPIAEFVFHSPSPFLASVGMALLTFTSLSWRARWRLVPSS